MSTRPRNGASVVEGAVGGLTNTAFGRSAFTYADQHGVALTLVSSDINSANHNYPTNYNEAIYVGGSLYDSAPNNTCSGPGGLPGIGSLPSPPSDFEDGCNELLDLLGNFPGCTTPIALSARAAAARAGAGRGPLRRSRRGRPAADH